MTQTLQENVWRPVKLGGQSSGYTITNYAVSSSWYNKIIDVSNGNRYSRLRRYYEADKASVEISRAMDIIAEDITSCNADTKSPFEIDFDDDHKLTRTYMTLINAAQESWAERTCFDEELFNRVRRTLVLGCTFYRKNKDGTLSELPSERFVGYVISENDENVVTHYLYDPALERFDKRGRRTYSRSGGAAMKANPDMYEPISIDDLVVLKIGEGPFGKSLIEDVYRTWKQLDLLEQAVLIYRVVRAPERRIFYIDTGNLQGPKREAAMEKQRIRLAQKRVAKGGEVETEYDPHSTGEDIFIPTNSSGKGSRVETLPGGTAIGELADLDYWRKKLASGLRIPASMIDSQQEGADQHQFNDMRVGQMYQIEMRYLGHVKRLKAGIVKPLAENFEDFCEKREIKLKKEATFGITEAMSFSIYREIEINSTLMNVYASSSNMPSISRRYALERFMNMDKEELVENEYDRLMELGLDDKQIKDMPEHVMRNLVYGDGRLGTKYGIKVEESTGF